MPRSRLWIAAIATLALLALVATWWLRDAEEPRGWVTSPVEKGPIVATVTATGTVNPVKSVTVGTYVSGPIQDIFVDYNSPVRKGAVTS